MGQPRGHVNLPPLGEFLEIPCLDKEQLAPCKGTLLMRKCLPLGPYSRPRTAIRPSEVYAGLKRAASDVLSWAAPAFPWDNLAVPSPRTTMLFCQLEDRSVFIKLHTDLPCSQENASP